MESADEQNGNGSQEALPPPPPDVPPNVVPVKAEPEPVKKKPLRVPIARRGLGSKGQKMPLLTNHFKVNVTNTEGYFFHYCVSLAYEDGRPVDGKGVGRKAAAAALNNGNASPDGHGSPNEGDRKRLRRPYHSKTFKVEISFAAKSPCKPLQMPCVVRNQRIPKKPLECWILYCDSMPPSNVSTTMIIQPGPVVDFLIANQNVRDPFSLDWAK
ncbi:hypothetical protein H0E87_001887, partial [Populus deltoides]